MNACGHVGREDAGLQEITCEAPPHAVDGEYRSYLLTDDSGGETLLVGMALQAGL